MREAPELQRTLRVGIGALVAVGGLAVATHHETAMTVEVSAVESPLVKQMGHLPVAECLLLQNVLALSCETPLPQETTTSTTASTTTTLPPEIVKERLPKRPASRTIVSPTTTLAAKEGERIDLGVFEATCYALPPKGTRGGPGSIAVDPDAIPMGTHLYVEGYGEGAARDTGGAIDGRRIDVWKSSEAECIQWGRRKVRVWKIAS